MNRGANPVVHGAWELKERLGTGGFGNVNRWQNKETEEQIAIKQCRQELSMKNKERWCLEIQIMKRLNHPNVVAAKDVPAVLEHLSTNDIPLLAMEFCQGGDLRKYLNLLDNCCGMREGSILILLRDISSALMYLHKKRIIHRDLKPENIVLQQGEKRLIHKIIDLGYAKELDQTSLCTSFVGTLQYLAPELLEQRVYSVTVDYWSFGTLVFECISGFRPFLPAWQPVQWHTKLLEKEENDIVAYEDIQGTVHFKKTLPQPNNINSFLTTKLEEWLELMLRWSGERRGRDLNGEGELSSRSPQYSFQQLDLILELKMVHVLNMLTAELLSYAVTSEETVASLQRRIEEDTGVAPDDQELLLEAGLALEPHNMAAQSAVDYSTIDGSRNDVPLVFLFDRTNCNYEPQFSPRELPENIRAIQKDPKQKLNYRHMRKTYAQAWHTIRTLKEDWQRLQQGQKAAMMSLLRHNGTLSKQKNEMNSTFQHLRSTVDFFNASLKIDIQKYMEQKVTGIASEKLLSTWKDMEQTATNFGQDTVNNLEEEMMSLQTDIVDLQRQPWRNGEALESLELKAMDLFRKLREKPRDQRPPGDCQEVLKLVVQAIQFYEKKLRDFYTHLSKTVLCRQRVMEMRPRLEGTVLHMAQSQQRLLELQTRRQRELWELLKVACTKIQSPVSGSPVGAQTVLTPPLVQSRPNSLQALNQPESFVLIEESKTYENRLQSLMSETIQGTEEDLQMLEDWEWLKSPQSLCDV
ncbi:inhibitor of nuclear factor kappa-B kinase subunit beta [Engraulis encrasicolus]|uniref:inhibitor of nuclear factor kappa-B kinase subunit beta n=1 Tax=Engraulis encrasicolus TaxID=184585 RepID=UPI002FD569FA